MPSAETLDQKRRTENVPWKGGQDAVNASKNAAAPIWLPELPLGRIVATPGALRKISAEEIRTALHRHRSREWGTLPPRDQAVNEQALIDGVRILSCYQTTAGVKLWIITEGDRSVTTVLLPEDY